MLPGFLPASRASLVFDVLILALVVVIPWLLVNIRLARRGDYRRHRFAQTVLTGAVLALVLWFEVDIRVFGWRHLAEGSSFAGPILQTVLAVHVVLASLTLALWIGTFALAQWHFGRQPQPGSHSRWHRILGWTTLAATSATALTGWLFYWMAFVA